MDIRSWGRLDSNQRPTDYVSGGPAMAKVNFAINCQRPSADTASTNLMTTAFSSEQSKHGWDRLAEHMRNAKQANALSRLEAGQETAVDLDLRVWAVTGSNRRPLRCKRILGQTCYLGFLVFSQVGGPFPVVRGSLRWTALATSCCTFAARNKQPVPARRTLFC